MSTPSQVEEIVRTALDKKTAAERAHYLDEACGTDAELRSSVERLLETHPQADDDEEDDHETPLDFLRPSDSPGSLGRLGHYEVLQILGAGGFGTVLKAFDGKLHRLVAIKVIAQVLAASARARKKFLREARAAAAVRHRNVVSIYAVEDLPIPHLVMEYIAGETLQQKLNREGPLAVADVLGIGRQIASGLTAAHSQGLIHRDIKPANILLEEGALRVKITDFGLARAADDSSVTQSGDITGTPMYMAPEQALGATLDHRADLFSLGSVLYALCTGRPPFQASSMMAVLKCVAEETPPPIREISPGIPEWLCDLIARLQAKSREDRFSTAQEVADLLAQHLAELERPRSVPRLPVVLAPAVANTLRVRAVPETALAIRRTNLRNWRWTAAAGLLILVGSLGFTEATGVTDFHGTVIRLFSPKETLVVEKRLRVRQEPPPSTKPDERPLESVPKSDERPADASAWERPVAALPAMEQIKAVADRLKALNPGFDGNITPTVKNGVVTGLTLKTDHVTDLSPIRVWTGLQRLDIQGSGRDKGSLVNLTPLQGMSLSELIVRENKASDLTPLLGMPLKLLWLDRNPVLDLSPLKESPLKNLSIVGTRVQSLTALEGMKLEALYCFDLPVSNLSPLMGMPLKTLACEHTKVSDLSPLKGMKLKELHINDTRASDLALLKSFPLTVLRLDYRPDREELLRSLKGLEHINSKPAAQFWKDVHGQGTPPAELPADASFPRDPFVPTEATVPPLEQIVNSIGMKLVLIPAGEFTMGSPDSESGAAPYEKPQHRVRITRPFYLGATEVTQGRYRTVTGASPSSYQGSDDLPVEQVLWLDAIHCCNVLSCREGLPEFYRIEEGRVEVPDWTGPGYRLPTEAEWEYACRAGSTTRYCYGDDAQRLGEYAWYAGNAERRTHPVGGKRPNAFGLYDMYGNVWEWCWDSFDPTYFGQSPAADPLGPAPATDMGVIRGGGWGRSPRSATRLALPPGYRVPVSIATVGFRVARFEARSTTDRAFAGKRPQPLVRVIRSPTIDLAEAEKTRNTRIGQKAAPLAVEAWVNGAPLSDLDLKGKVVLLAFWGVWHGPSKANFPQLREWNEKHTGKGLVMIGLTHYANFSWDEKAAKAGPSQDKVAPEEERAMLEKFAAQHKLTHRLAIEKQRALSQYYRVTSIPAVVVIDRAGIVRLIQFGGSKASTKAIGDLLETLLSPEASVVD